MDICCTCLKNSTHVNSNLMEMLIEKTKKEIMELCPDISKITVERALTNLVKSGYIAKVGAGPSTGYVRI